ncbi:MAG: DUF362 domain-containing protein [Christensenellales bacterium]
MKKSIYTAYGSDIKATTLLILNAANAKSMVPAGAKISLKPNLVVGRPASEGATTHPEIAAGIIEYFRESGFNEIEIIEGSWVGDDTSRAFSRCGFDAIGKKYGVPLYDLKKDRAVSVSTPIGDLKICRRAYDADFLINLPVMKGHCQTVITCALKNLKGCIPDSEKRRYHALGLHGPIAALAGALRPQMILVDGICGDLSFEEGGNPVQQDRLILATDPVKTDLYACSLMGVDPGEVNYIALAAQYGAGEHSLSQDEVMQVNKPSPLAAAPERSYKVRALAKNVREDSACSACYGALIHALGRIDEQGLLHNVPETFIGQGFRGKAISNDGVGIGVCAGGAKRCVMGCPPSSQDIIAELLKK